MIRIIRMMNSLNLLQSVDYQDCKFELEAFG